jgi:hypothetical protein
MRLAKSLNFAVLVLSTFAFSTRAKADQVVLGLDTTETFESVGSNQTVSQDATVSTTTTIDGFAFYLSDTSGAPLTYSLTDLTSGTVLFTETVDDTTLDPTLTNIAIPEGTKQWLEVYMTPITLNGGSDIYAFSVSSAGGMKIGINPTAFTEVGMAPSGGLNLGLRVWDPPAPAATPEPSSLVLMGTGVLTAAGAMRRRFVR